MSLSLQSADQRQKAEPHTKFKQSWDYIHGKIWKEYGNYVKSTPYNDESTAYIINARTTAYNGERTAYNGEITTYNARTTAYNSESTAYITFEPLLIDKMPFDHLRQLWLSIKENERWSHCLFALYLFIRQESQE
jgi:hypothetical protein